MSAQEQRAFLQTARTAVLVSLGPDGMPDPVGMWFVLDGDDVWMRTYAASQKAVNLERDPRAAVLFEDGQRYAELRGLQLSGRMELTRDAERIADVWTGLAMKYERLPPEAVEGFRDAALARAAKQVAMRLVVERVVSWDHAKLSEGETRVQRSGAEEIATKQ